MICSACNDNAEFDDGFCSACGVEQPSSSLPVKRQPSSLPAIWREAAPVVVRSAALVAAGIAAEFLLRSMARGAMPATSRKRSVAPPVPATTTHLEEVVTISHSVITRRLFIRR
jgi:hypothetical protein